MPSPGHLIKGLGGQAKELDLFWRIKDGFFRVQTGK
jgi:hypothetical protein